MKPRHIVLAMLGFVAACVFTAPAMGEERTPQEFDVRPYVAMAYVHSQTQLTLLQRMQFNCPEGMRRALVVDKTKPVAWFGCWREKDGKVEIGFEDGDRRVVGRELFTWVDEAAPSGAPPNTRKPTDRDA